MIVDFSSDLVKLINIVMYIWAGSTCKCTPSSWHVQTVVSSIYVIFLLGSLHWTEMTALGLKLYIHFALPITPMREHGDVRHRILDENEIDASNTDDVFHLQYNTSTDKLQFWLGMSFSSSRVHLVPNNNNLLRIEIDRAYKQQVLPLLGKKINRNTVLKHWFSCNLI